MLGNAGRRRYVAPMTLFSPRLPHVLTRADLAELIAPTYARETGIGPELALERTTRALKATSLVNKLYDAISPALVTAQGERSEDKLMDALSKAVVKRSSKIKAAPATPQLSAVIVLLNVELGLAPDAMRATLESGKGGELLKQGFAALGKHLVEHLVG